VQGPEQAANPARWISASLVALLVVGLGLAPAALTRTSATPVLAQAVLASRMSGVVSVKLPSSHVFSLLRGRRLVPVGSIIDATRGTVELLTAGAPPGATQYGFFDGGAFTVSQDRSGLTTLALVGGRSAAATCGGRFGAGRAAAVSPAVLRLLHASAHGRFRTQGRYAAATVRGTQWTTSETCQGTSIADRSGVVATRTSNGSVSNSLRPGQQVLYHCAPRGQQPVSRGYCVLILLRRESYVLNGKRVNLFEFNTGVGTNSPDMTAELCVRGPSHLFCTAYPLVGAESFAFRIALAFCVPAQGPGTYDVTWKVRSIALGAPLTFRAPVGEPFIPCHTLQGDSFVGNSRGSLAADVKIVNRYSLPTEAHGRSIAIYLTPTAITGQQTLRGVIYADSGRAPGALLGTTDELTYRPSDGSGWRYLFFPRHRTRSNPSGLLQLNSGNYWLGVIAGGQTSVAGVAFDPIPGADVHNTNPYLAGPSDPFGPIATGDERLSLYLAYYAPPF
jgi:hypothetical protein